MSRLPAAPKPACTPLPSPRHPIPKRGKLCASTLTAQRRHRASRQEFPCSDKCFMSKSISNAQRRPPALGFGWKWGSIQMLSRVETLGCFLAAVAASGTGRAAQVRSHRQRLPCMACLGPGSCPHPCLHPCLHSQLRLALGIFLPNAGDRRSYRTAQPHSVCVASHPYRSPCRGLLSHSMQQLGLYRTEQKMRPSLKPWHGMACQGTDPGTCTLIVSFSITFYRRG